VSDCPSSTVFPLKRPFESMVLLYISAYNVYTWTPEDVGIWLESLSLGEYRDAFIGHEIRGTELLSLDKGDIQVSIIFANYFLA